MRNLGFIHLQTSFSTILIISHDLLPDHHLKRPSKAAMISPKCLHQIAYIHILDTTERPDCLLRFEATRSPIPRCCPCRHTGLKSRHNSKFSGIGNLKVHLSPAEAVAIESPGKPRRGNRLRLQFRGLHAPGRQSRKFM